MRDSQDEFPARHEAPPRKPNPLPPTSDLPRFVEEGERDPFGQNEELLNLASRRSFEIAVRIATLAHTQGLGMMLPWPDPAWIDPALHPWRSIVSCSPDERALRWAEIPPPAVHWGPAHGTAIPTAIPNLVQRAALCVAALGDRVPPEAYDQLTELLEDLGYIALGREYRDDKIDAPRSGRRPLRFFYTIGEIAVLFYVHNIIHGDMTPNNFHYDEEKRTALVGDVGTVCFLKRPITLEEHASDIGLMKLTCSFEEWEALKLGYREKAPEQAARVFQLI